MCYALVRRHGTWKPVHNREKKNNEAMVLCIRTDLKVTMTVCVLIPGDGEIQLS